MEARTIKKNEEYHDLLDELAEKRFFGEITLYIQGGNIESSRVSERKTKSEVKAQMESLRSARPKATAVVRPKDRASGGNC